MVIITLTVNTTLYLKDIPLSETDIDTFSNSARKKKYNNNTLKTIKSVINDICRFAECYSYGKYHNVLWGTTWHKDKDTDYLKEIGKDIQKIIEKKLLILLTNHYDGIQRIAVTDRSDALNEIMRADAKVKVDTGR